MQLIEERKANAAKRLADLHESLEVSEQICKDKACVYATGSYGRLEASEHSDLDLFIVGLPDASRGRKLSRLDEILVKADLIDTTRALRFQEFSGDGEYLTHYSVENLVRKLGTQSDDSDNTLTARLLMLLESKALLGGDVHRQAISEVIAAYWRDYEDHKNDFMPAYLTNDILRLWRTLCVNYEARTATDPAEKKAKRKLKNYKLKHSRLLTCYSALVYLLRVHAANGTVTPHDAIDMVSRTPIERLLWLAEQDVSSKVKASLSDLIAKYESFLASIDAPENELVSRFMNHRDAQDLLRSAYSFGDQIYELLHSLGEGNRFFRLLVV